MLYKKDYRLVNAACSPQSNSTLPTSVPSERLFSAAKEILTDKRSKMSDDIFDQLMFLRSAFKNSL